MSQSYADMDSRDATVLFYLFYFFGLIQVFVGNTGKNTIVYNELNGSIVARYTRFQPTAWHNHISIRVELYGCKGTFFGKILLLWNSVKIQTNPCCLWRLFGKTTNNNEQTKIKFRRTEKLCYWAYYVVVQFFPWLDFIFLCFNLIIIALSYITIPQNKGK